MKKCVIIGAAPLSDISHITVRHGDMLICADGGVKYAKALGLEPDLVLGDFDSCDKSEADGLCSVTFPAHKDDTDLMIAIKYAIGSHCTDFTIYGALGGRLDHTVAAFSSLAFLADNHLHGRLVGPKTTVELLCSGKHKIKKNTGYISLFPFGCDCVNISVSGTAYDGEALLTSSFPLGVSNEIVANEACIEVMDGENESRVLLICCEKEN